MPRNLSKYERAWRERQGHAVTSVKLPDEPPTPSAPDPVPPPVAVVTDPAASGETAQDVPVAAGTTNTAANTQATSKAKPVPKSPTTDKK